MKVVRSGMFGRGSFAPGVYYEEAFEPDAPPRFRTGVPVFVGCGPMFVEDRTKDRTEVPEWTPIYVSRWQQLKFLPSSSENGYLGAVVHGFFENGGQRCVIVTVKKAGGLVKSLCEPFAQGGVLEDLEDVDLVCVPDAMLLAQRNELWEV